MTTLPEGHDTGADQPDQSQDPEREYEPEEDPEEEIDPALDPEEEIDTEGAESGDSQEDGSEGFTPLSYNQDPEEEPD